MDLRDCLQVLDAEGAGVVAVVRGPRPAAFNRLGLVAEVFGHLDMERALQDPADQPGQQATLASPSGAAREDGS